MSKAREYFKEWMEKEGYEYDNIPIPELMQSYADEQLKEAEEQNKDLMDDILEIQDEIICKETTTNDIWHLLDNLKNQQDNE